LTTQRYDSDAFDPIDGYTLERYAAVCRALVRVPGGSSRHLESALDDLALTTERWARIRAAWTERIARDPYVRAAFRELYVGRDQRDGNE
jgi:hypothetical protein